MENTEILFERLLSGKKSETDKMIAELEAEHGLFDFKCKSDSDGTTGLNNDDRANFSKALSGFANAAGGLLIWGIDKKNKKPGKYRLIKKPESFVESLNTAIPELAMPYVEGVQNKLIFKTKDEGLVITYIPESEKTPHMAMTEKRYYKRIGDSFRMMEHRDVEDMFGRRNRPKLVLNLKAELSAESKPAATYLLRITIRNEGRAISQHYGFDFEFVTKLLERSLASYQAGQGLILDSTPREIGGVGMLKYRNSNNSPVYPDETAVISPNNYGIGHITFQITTSQLEAYKDFKLQYVVYSENMLSQKREIKFGDLFL